MKSADQMRRLFNSAAVQTNAAPDDAVFEKIKTAYTRTVQRKSAQQEPSMWRFVMKSPLTRLAAAAAVVIACVIGLSLWRTTGSGIVLADVLARVEQVKAFRYQWNVKTTGEEPNKPYSGLGYILETRGTTLISQKYGWKNKVERLDPKGGESTFGENYLFPETKIMIIIRPKQRQYWRAEVDDGYVAKRWQKSDPRTFLKQILECKYESMGRATIDGIEVEGFQTTDPNFSRGGKNRQIDVKVWVDVKTRLPVRHDSTIADLEGGKIIRHDYCVEHDFQWDVPVEAAEFKPVIPDDYTSLVTKFPFPYITEETAIQGLKLLVELLGKYPENITDVDVTVLRSAEKSETPAALRLKEEIKGLTDEEIGNRLVDFLMPIRGLVTFCKVRLFWDDLQLKYYGKTVTPKDADKVLVRWKLSDKEYRVIFGDLHTETVTAEALAELEKSLPK